MVKKLVSRSKFAAMAKVSPAAITKACKGILTRAVDGKFIDSEHPDALAYVAHNDPNRTANRPDVVPGVDSLYAEAVEYAKAIGKLTASSLKSQFGIGSDRATKLVGVIKAAGGLELPTKAEPVPVVRFNAEGKLADTSGLAKKVKAAFHAESTYQTLATLAAPPDEEEAEEQLPSPSDFPDVEELGDLTLRELIDKFGTAERFKVWLQARKSLVDIGAKEIANAEKRGRLIPRDFVEAHIIGNFNRVHINLMTDAAQTIARRLVGDIKAGASVEDCEVFVSDQISRHVKEAKATIERVLANVGV